MKKVERLVERLKLFETDILKTVESIVKNDEAYILDLNTAQLADYGKDSNGNAVEPPYTPFTVSIKIQKGQPTNKVTLKDEGYFHSSFTIEYLEDGFKIWATDWKTKKLVAHYGDAIFGLDDINLKEWIEEELRPRLQKELKNLLL